MQSNQPVEIQQSSSKSQHKESESEQLNTHVTAHLEVRFDTNFSDFVLERWQWNANILIFFFAVAKHKPSDVLIPK